MTQEKNETRKTDDKTTVEFRPSSGDGPYKVSVPARHIGPDKKRGRDIAARELGRTVFTNR